MEELLSIESLDREILEDAQKKAARILKNTDDSISVSKAEWENKLKQNLDTAREHFDEKIKEGRREILARFPMDKRKIRSETIERFLNQAMENFLQSLDRSSLLSILKRELALRAVEISSSHSEGEIRYRLLSKDECSALVSDSFPGLSFRFSEDPLYAIRGSFPALVIEFPDLRLIASVDRAANELLLDKRAELTSALLGTLEDLICTGGDRD
ncbi:MAG: hypothetical protein FWG27_06475 [Treponema sp.]|nr:hypothetical protein [Treponema sp.]